MAPEESGLNQCPPCGGCDEEVVEKKNIRKRVCIVIVLIVLGVCLAIFSVPAWSPYKMRSYNSTALSELKNAVHLQHEYYKVNKTYAYSIQILEEDPYYFVPYKGVVIRIVSADKDYYKMESYHKKGDKLWEKRSDSHYSWYEWKDHKKIGPAQAL